MNAPLPPLDHVPLAALDARYMAVALSLARHGLGCTAPNPSVAALLVDPRSGEIIARARTGSGGRPHAESIVLAEAGERARGATMYVTLEPCSHHGKTPPCAQTVIKSGIRRVVAAISDPDRRVVGRGFTMLRAAGIAVEVGVLEEAGRWVNAGHILRSTLRRPFVQLKIAVSADGRIAPGIGKPVWVTGAEARAHAHLMRTRADAIMVGRGTAVADDPALTCRLPGLESRSPIRIVLDSTLLTPPDSTLARTARDVPFWVFAMAGVAPERRRPLEAAGALVHVLPASMGRPDLTAVMAKLADEGITRLMVEGGPTLAQALMEAGLVDEVAIFRGTHELGALALRPFGNRGMEELGNKRDWQVAREAVFGEDKLAVYRSERTRELLAKLVPKA